MTVGRWSIRNVLVLGEIPCLLNLPLTDFEAGAESSILFLGKIPHYRFMQVSSVELEIESGPDGQCRKSPAGSSGSILY